ncbi:MAG: DnaA N-terminal domain-containing protein, partial [Candidatus Saccharimonas aalborgensis]
MYHSLWQSVLGEIELTVSHANFTTWFKNTELLECSSDRVVVGVPNVFAIRQFEVKFNDQIVSILKKNGVEPLRVSYVVKTVKKSIISRETTANNSELD